jgi:SAM-dependent methyltransferase
MTAMWLTRLRVQLKSLLPRDSLPYRLGHLCYQLLVKIQDRLEKKNPPRTISENSIFTREEEMSMCSIFPKEILDLTIELYRPRSVLDVGCGTGISLDYFQRKGARVRGLEGSALAISKARHPNLISLHDLSAPLQLDEKFDLVWCFEVAEHIHPKNLSTFLETLTNHGDRILLSAARPGQGGLGHLNEQPAEYWIGRMRDWGFALADETVRYRALPDHFAANILVFEKTHGTR